MPQKWFPPILTLFLATAVVLTFGSHSSPLQAQNNPPANTTTTQAVTNSQCFYPTADTYIRDDFPNDNYGTEDRLRVSAIGDVEVDISYTYLRFNLDTIPDKATVTNATLEMYLDDISGAPDGQTLARLQAVDGNWGEASLTWDNRPSLSGPFDEQTISDNSGWKNWNATQIVFEWQNGTRTNYGLAVDSVGLSSLPALFYSREGSTYRQPRLCVDWSENVSPDDITVLAVEVTQGIQNWRNDARLVAGKETYVRVHTQTAFGGQFRTFATLTVDDGVNEPYELHPINPNGGHINVTHDPDRTALNDSFLFRLINPDPGELTLTAEVNPILSWRPNRYPPETNYSDNTRTVTVNFEEVPRVGLIMYRFGYTLEENGVETTYTTPFTDTYQTRDWLQRAFPVSDLVMSVREEDFGMGEIVSPTKRTLTTPTSGEVNDWLSTKREWDLTHQSWIHRRVGDARDIRYYGLVTKEGGFMRGSAPFNGRVGSGPTGRAASWDADGIMGDWYTGHELGHSFNRSHVAGDPNGKAGSCGGEAGTDSNYPYSAGFISPNSGAATDFYGFDIGSDYRTYGIIPQDMRVYDPTWRDVMTYCAPQWISDYTYEGIMTYLQNNITAVSENDPNINTAVRRNVTDRVLISGRIDLPSGEATFNPIYLITNAAEVDPPSSGDYNIIMRSNSGTELASYPFAPTEFHSGPDNPDGASAPPVHYLQISELVPFVTNTAEIEVSGPTGTLATFTASANAPTVNITTPNGGETLSGDTIDVTWTGSDVDGDAIYYTVQFSPDNGQTWEMLAQNITAPTVSLNRNNIQTTDEGLFRVWASDGFNTSVDTSDATFETSSRAPEVTILSPPADTIMAANQTLTLRADAFSPNIGTLDEDQILWASSRDGILGNGENLAVTDLSLGTHDISVLVGDGTGLTAFTTVENITVVEDPRFLPTQPDSLDVNPKVLVFWPEEGILTGTIQIDNLNNTDSIRWTAASITPWLEEDKTSGETSDTMTVTIDPTQLEEGVNEGVILFASQDNLGELVTVNVVAVKPPRGLSLYLPLINR